MAALIKIGGLLILTAASLVYGGQKIREERRKLLMAEALLDLVKQVGENIGHRMKPLPEIFQSYRNTPLEQCGFLADVRAQSLRSAWELHASDFSVLNDRATEVFSEFCTEIGHGYREEELKLCAFVQNQLREECQQIRNDAKNKEKLYRTIPPLMAMSAALVLM